MAEEQMEEASTAGAAATPFQLQFDKPIPFQVSSLVPPLNRSSSDLPNTEFVLLLVQSSRSVSRSY
jgi:Flp pilus assembly protein TadG